MAEYIERENLLEQLEKIPAYFDSGDTRYGIEIAIDQTKKQPTADVVEVKHGKWEKFDQECEVEYVCSKCNFCIIEADPKQDCAFTYCPNCGAKLDAKDGAE